MSSQHALLPIVLRALRSARRAWPPFVGALALSSLSACLLDDCPDDFHGVRPGDRFETTLLERRAREHASDARDPDCSRLTAFGEGTILVGKIELDGPGDDCSDRATLALESLSGATVVGRGVRFANGCAGNLELRLVARRSGADFTASPVRADPDWVVERLFHVASDPGLCSPEVDDPPSACLDWFVAENRRL